MQCILFILIALIVFKLYTKSNRRTSLCATRYNYEMIADADFFGGSAEFSESAKCTPESSENPPVRPKV
jgi:hypothetical protein